MTVTGPDFLALQVRDLDRAAEFYEAHLRLRRPPANHDQLVVAGIPIVTAPFDGPFGRTFVFSDPDGYAITIHDKA